MRESHLFAILFFANTRIELQNIYECKSGDTYPILSVKKKEKINIEE